MRKHRSLLFPPSKGSQVRASTRQQIGIVICLLVLVVPLLFLRFSNDVFDLPKATALWVGSLVLLVLLSIAFLQGWRVAGQKSVVVSVWLLALVSLLLTLTSSTFATTSFFGESGRHSGVITFLSLSLLHLSVISLDKTWERRVLWSILCASAIHSIYVLIQFFGLDPFEWQSRSTSNFVHGLLGNPNTGSAFSGVAASVGAALLIEHQSIRAKSGPVLMAIAANVLAIGCMKSSTGVLALVPGVLLVAVYWVRDVSRWLRFIAIANWAGLALLVSVNWSLAGAFALIGSSVALWSLSFRRFQSRAGLHINGGRRIRLLLVAVTAISFTSVFLSGPIAQAWRDGMRERRYFFRAAISGVSDRPLFGFGLDSFGKYFNLYRPREHALRLENSWTSSVHSVPLGLLFSGGILLFGFFLAVVVTTLRVAIKSRKNSDDMSSIDGRIAVFLSCLLGILFNVENVALLVLLYVASASCIVVALPQIHVPRRRIGQNSPRRRKTVISIVALVGLICALCLPAITRPIRASFHAHAGLTDKAIGNFASSEAHLEASVELAPWTSSYWYELTSARISLGKIAEAAESARKAVDSSNFSGVASVQAARIIGLSGDVSECLVVLQETLSKNPHSRALRREALTLARQLEAAALQLGASEVALTSRELISQLEIDVER